MRDLLVPKDDDRPLNIGAGGKRCHQRILH